MILKPVIPKPVILKPVILKPVILKPVILKPVILKPVIPKPTQNLLEPSCKTCTSGRGTRSGGCRSSSRGGSAGEAWERGASGSSSRTRQLARAPRCGCLSQSSTVGQDLHGSARCMQSCIADGSRSDRGTSAVARDRGRHSLRCGRLAPHRTRTNLSRGSARCRSRAPIAARRGCRRCSCWERAGDTLAAARTLARRPAHPDATPGTPHAYRRIRITPTLGAKCFIPQSTSS